MNSPRAIAAQNTCTTSGTIRSENLAMHASVHPSPRKGHRGPRPRARQRADRRGASPYGLGYATTGALLKHRARMT